MKTDHQITCSRKEVEKIEKIARNRTAGIWRIKRAKIILGILERKTVDRLVLDVRVPPRSIKKCQEKYAKEGLKYFEKPDRRPTQREAAVERMLAFLENPPHPRSRQWNSLTVYYIGRDFTVRFLILPWIKSQNLASRILGGITKQLPLDWEARYGFRPVLLETFVQMDRFRGTCYRAANWIQVGTTQGYSLYGQEHKKSVPTKAILVYPLHRNFRQILCKIH